MEEQHLHHPLLPEATTSNDDTLSSTTTSSMVQRLLVIVFVGIISLWANNEASKGFEIRVINGMKGTSAGDKFSLFYVCNDEATRLVQRATTSVAKILYSKVDSMPEKSIDQIDVRLCRHNLTCDYMVIRKTSEEKNSYELSLSPVILEFEDFRYRIRKEIQRGVAEVLLFDKRDRVPTMLINGLVEYMINLEGNDGMSAMFKPRNSSGRCWEDNDPKVVARFLRNCEARSEGFIGRLYKEMSRDDWDELSLDNALGMTAIPLCESLHNDITSISGFR